MMGRLFEYWLYGSDSFPWRMRRVEAAIVPLETRTNAMRVKKSRRPLTVDGQRWAPIALLVCAILEPTSVRAMDKEKSKEQGAIDQIASRTPVR